MKDHAIPSSWAEGTLADLSLVIQGQSPPGSSYNTQGSGLPFFQGKAEFGPISPTAVKWCTEPTKIAEQGDILVSVRAPVGPTNLANMRCCIGRGLAAVRPPDQIPSRFILYYLRYSQYLLGRQATGTTFKAVSGKQLRNHPVIVPPVSEQHRIVDAIESYFTRLDDAVVTLERVQRNLKRYRASVLQAAVEGRLVPTEAELARAEGRDYEPASVLLERILSERRRRWEEAELAKVKAKGKTPKNDKWRAKYEDPVVPVAEDLPGLPEGWHWATMNQLIVSGPQNGVYVPKSQYGAGTPILRIDDYQTDWSRSSGDMQQIAISDDDAEKYGLGLGDIVVNRVNSPSHLGKSLVVRERHIPAVFESNMMRFGLGDSVEPSYIQYYLSSIAGKTRLTANAKWAVNQASINQGDVGSTWVPLPPSVEQQRIVAEVERVLATAEDISATAIASAARAIRLRQSILRWAFGGRLVDQDPSDEPASRLLERIQAERESSRGNPRRSPRRPRARSPKA